MTSTQFSDTVVTKHFVARAEQDGGAWRVALFTADNTALSAKGWGLGGGFPSSAAALDEASAVLVDADKSVDRGLALKARDEEFMRGGE